MLETRSLILPECDVTTEVMASDSKIISELADRLSQSLRTALLDAYEAGLRDRDTKIGKDLQNAISGLMESLKAAISKQKELRFDLISEVLDRPITENKQLGIPRQRVARGTAEPAVIDALRKFPTGATTMEIFQRGSVKYNTVRGTLWRLQQDEKVRRIGKKWHLSPKLKALSPVSGDSAK